MKVLIVGAGFGGLALAAYLRRDGHDVTLVERRVRRDYHGFVMGLWRNGLRTLEPFGIVDDIQALGLPVTTELIREQTGEVLATMDYQRLVQRGGSVFLLPHADLHAILTDLVANTPVHYGAEVQTLRSAARSVFVTLSDGFAATFDLVVGADGLHSWVRKTQFGDEGLSGAGIHMWLYIAPSGHIALNEPNNLYGEGEYICLLPTLGGQVGAQFLASIPDYEPETSERRIAGLRARFGDFGWVIPNLLASLDNPHAIASFEIEQVSLGSWSQGRVTLLGDAAHAVAPNTTMGCSMALEDAHVLAEEIRGSSADDVEGALARYECRRRERLEQIQRTSNFLLWWLGMKNRGMVFLRNMGMHLAQPSMLLRDMEEITDPRHDV